jgi:hypothetical protein
MMQPLSFKPFYMALFVSLFSCSFLSGQTIKFKLVDTDAVEAEVFGMEAFLKAFKGIDVPEPNIQYLWITNDGQYYFSNHLDGSAVQHRFDPSKLGGGNGAFTTFATVIYSDSDEDEPPKIIIDDTPIGTTPATPVKVSAVEGDNFIRLQKNSLNLVPEDTTAFILSVKNNLPDSDFLLEGFLVFLYDAPLSITTRDLSTSEISSTPLKEEAGTPLFTEFEYQRTLNYEQNIVLFGKPSSPASTSLNAAFNSAAFYEIKDLEPGDEKHLFVQMRNNQIHLDEVPSGGVGTARFMAVFLANDFNGEIDLPALPNDLAQKLNAIKLDALTGQPITFQLPGLQTSVVDTTIDIASYKAIGLSEVNSTLSRSHDPNQISLQACDCPADASAAQKIICKVDFENIGSGATEDVLITIPLPESIDATSFSGELITLFPDSPELREDMDIDIDEENNELSFEFPGLRLQGISPGEDNLLSRTGHIAFTVFTKAGTNISDIPPVQACIVFDTNPPFCTPESEVELVGSQSSHESVADKALSCNTCEVPEENQKYVFMGLPIWLWILILLVIAIAIYFAFFDE